MVTTSITNTLGVGSGIDIGSLVTQLVDAQFDAKNTQLTSKQDVLTAQISALGQLKSGVTGFASALTSLAKGGTLATQPTSSNTNAVRVSTLSGATLSSLSTRVNVNALAAAQVAATDRLPTDTVYGAGSFTLRFGTADFASDGSLSLTNPGDAITIPVTKADATLFDVADAINAAGKGVTANVISDGTGQRLMLRGPTGAGNAFTLTSADAGLAPLNVSGTSGGAAVQIKAGDASVTVDGVTFARSTNTISDLVPGVKLELQDVTSTPVTLGTTPATSNIIQAVSDVVETYNQLFTIIKEQTDPVSGNLRADSAVTGMVRKLQGLTLTKLLPDDGNGGPRTLAEIGVSTNRDGSLTLDQGKLLAISIKYPGKLEAMFAAGTGAIDNGLPAALNAISADVISTTSGLGAAEQRYGKVQSTLSDQQTKATQDAEAMRTRLTQQFASMDARVAAYKSTQTFLEQQIDAWNANS